MTREADELVELARVAVDDPDSLQGYVQQRGADAVTGLVGAVVSSLAPPASVALGVLVTLAGTVFGILGGVGHRDRQIERLARDRQALASALSMHPRIVAWYVGRMLWGEGLATWQTQGPVASRWPDGSSSSVQGINGACGRKITCELRMIRQAREVIGLLMKRVEAVGADVVRDELVDVGTPDDNVRGVELLAAGDVSILGSDDEVRTMTTNADGMMTNTRVPGLLASMARRLFGSGDASKVQMLAREQWRRVSSFTQAPADASLWLRFLRELHTLDEEGTRHPTVGWLDRLASLALVSGQVEIGWYGNHWQDTRPPGYYAGRKTGTMGSALPFVEAIAWYVALGRGLSNPALFVATMRQLALNESGATFGLPAITFNRLSAAQRRGRQYISAWGVFSFNEGAWQRIASPIDRLGETQSALDAAVGLSHQLARLIAAAGDSVARDGLGVMLTGDHNPMHGECSPFLEVAAPIIHYASVWQTSAQHQGNGSGAVGVHVFHAGPSYFDAWLRDGPEGTDAASRTQQPVAEHLLVRAKAYERASAMTSAYFSPILGVLWSIWSATDAHYRGEGVEV